MRHKNKKITIHGLEEKKKRKVLADTPENCEKMITEHKKRAEKIKLKLVVIGDHNNTRFYVKENRDVEEVKAQFLRSRKLENIKF